MNKVQISILIFYMCLGHMFGQEKSSRADNYFYAYAYADAINEYQKELQEGSLTNAQRLNLADAYFQTGNHQAASKIYLDIHHNDTIITSHRFNKMLQSLSKISQHEGVRALLASKSDLLSNELVENAEFNYELLDSKTRAETDFQILNVNGNSAQTDFSPAFFKDKLLFSSSRGSRQKEIYGPTGEAYLDIFVARIGADGDIVNPNLFEVLPDSEFHKSTPYYSESLNRIFYVLSNTQEDELLFDENGKNALAIGLARNSLAVQNTFSLLLKDLSTSFYYPYYEESSGKLFFAANFEDGYGGTDIYYVHTNNAQIMSEPINLGPRINSPGNEIAPFIFENNLYFSSDVFYGLGGMDVYKASIEENDAFSIPINLGNDINSTYDDFGFIIKKGSANNYLGYFASNRPGGKGKDDIYAFSANELPGLKTLVIKGLVVNPKSGQGIQEAKLEMLNPDGSLLRQGFTDTNGQYRLEIPWRNEVVLTATKENHSIYSKAFDKDELEKITGTSFEVEMAVLEDIVVNKEDKNVLKLNDFIFEKGKSAITQEIAAVLDEVVQAVQKFPQMKLQIESHTDSRGNRNTNKKISQEQADSIKKYLLENGVSSDNIVSATGYGETMLTNDCKDGVYCLEFLHNQNARTLFVVSNFEELK